MNVKEYFELFITFVGTALGYFFGEITGLMHALLAFTVLDYFTELLAAGILQALSLSLCFKELARKITIFILVGVAHVIDQELLGGTAMLRDAVIFFYLANEGLSIISNAVNIGIPIPDALKNKLLSFTEKKKKKTQKTPQQSNTGNSGN